MPELLVNGAVRSTPAELDTPLLYALRNDLGLAGTRFGCGTEQCGACLVLVDGVPAYACTLRVADAVGKEVTTVEGLGTDDRPHALQRAFLAENAAQCGFCTSGMLVRAAALLAANPAPDADAVRQALEPQLCRCGSHNRIVRAVLRASRESGER
ncbi:MAG TPA: 2Fe-2S iron-sulfur cluster-binding protein [Usitatibacter sp.]|nr:2Fe-2S iron-sulfur cluster-binding protein [Usitatibacter sp.]